MLSVPNLATQARCARILFGATVALEALRMRRKPA
jgi:hypothetical protein